MKIYFHISLIYIIFIIFFFTKLKKEHSGEMILVEHKNKICFKAERWKKKRNDEDKILMRLVMGPAIALICDGILINERKK